MKKKKPSELGPSKTVLSFTSNFIVPGIKSRIFKFKLKTRDNEMQILHHYGFQVT